MDQSNSGDTISDDDEWEDIADDSEMTTGHSDLPSIIADDQASQFANDGAAVPMEISPFSTSNWEEVFKLALQHVQEIGHVPYGFGIQEEEWDVDGYPEIEVIPSGRCGQKEIIVQLLDFIWHPWAIKWCQALGVLVHILESTN